MHIQCEIRVRHTRRKSVIIGLHFATKGRSQNLDLYLSIFAFNVRVDYAQKRILDIKSQDLHHAGWRIMLYITVNY